MTDFEPNEEYPQTLIVTRPVAGGSTDSATGRFVQGGVAQVLYEGPVDVQDERTELAWNAEGQAVAHADAAIYFEDGADLRSLRVGDTARVVGDPFDGQDVVLVGVRLLDGVGLANWLRPVR